jgi:hypothetical protein
VSRQRAFDKALSRDTKVPPTLEGYFIAGFFFGSGYEYGASALKELELALEAFQRMAAGGIALHQEFQLRLRRFARHKKNT